MTFHVTQFTVAVHHHNEITTEELTAILEALGKFLAVWFEASVRFGLFDQDANYVIVTPVDDMPTVTKERMN